MTVAEAEAECGLSVLVGARRQNSSNFMYATLLPAFDVIWQIEKEDNHEDTSSDTGAWRVGVSCLWQKNATVKKLMDVSKLN
jgi:hypothetical protein